MIDKKQIWPNILLVPVAIAGAMVYAPFSWVRYEWQNYKDRKRRKEYLQNRKK